MATPPYRVLLVDDDTDVRTLARRHLERSGDFSVIAEAADGDEATRVAAAHQPDVALLDLNMPGTDGLTALPRIRAVAPQCTVVVLSAMQRPEAEEQAKAAGASGFLVKQRSWRALPADLMDVLHRAEDASPHDTGVELPASLTSGREARRFLRATLPGWGAEDLLDDAQLLTSELVNNAIVHASSAVRVRLRFADRCLRIEVTDAGAGALQRQPGRRGDTSGRGLHLVDVLAASWGTSADRDGKVVWFELEEQAAAEPGHGASPSAGRDGARE
ncbi:MAG: response regulator [Egibacteraceae bacterium]